MGFFDEASSSDDEGRTVAIAASAAIATGPRTKKDDKEQQQQDDEEDDPLDAYMKTLGSAEDGQPHQPGTPEDKHTASWNNIRYDDDDDENDDDALASFGDTSRSAGARKNSRLQEDEENRSSARLASAQAAFASAFHTAKNNNTTTTNNSNPLNHSYDTNQSTTTQRLDDNDTTASSAPILGNTVEAAATAAALPPFAKCFWEGSDTARGRKWRQDHAVILCPSSSSSSQTNSNNPTNTHSKRGIGMEAKHENETSRGTNNKAFQTMDPILDFSELRSVFGDPLLAELAKQNYTTPTLVQSQTLPVALSGWDALITAATGQGKTLAYLWPMIVHLRHQAPLQTEHNEHGPLGLVLVPTRELALQVQKQAKPMLLAASGTGTADNTNNNRKPPSLLTCRAVIGGQGKYLLRQELKKAGGVHLVVATPGRLLDVVSDRKGLSLHRVTMVVLDEADKMLQMGFETQVRLVLQQIRPDRQTLLLSATMGKRMEAVASEWLSSSSSKATPAIRISVGRTGEASQNVQQHVMVVPNEAAKDTFLMEMLPILSQVGRTVVFVATRENCERLASLVRATPAMATTAVLTLHGDKHQSDRTAAVRAFTKGDVTVLIATDVAGRGLDIPNICTVLSFDPAKNLDSHVHRVGRAGRLSKETSQQQIGSSYTLLTPKNADFALVLYNAFEREGREVSPELKQLALSSRRHTGHIDSRTKTNKAGLGFAAEVHGIDPSARDGTRNYGLPTDTFAPPAKRSRWS